MPEQLTLLVALYNHDSVVQDGEGEPSGASWQLSPRRRPPRAEHIGAPNLGAGGSHPQAIMMQEERAASLHGSRRTL